MNASQILNFTRGIFNCTDVRAPITLSFLTASFSFVFLLVIVSGNSLIILAISKDPYNELKKPFIALVGNLAGADLIVGFVVTPISIAIHIMEGIGENIMVKRILWVRVLHLAYFISCTASLLNMTALTIDRHIAIAYPFRYRSSYTARKPLRTFALIWVIALGLPFVYLKVGYVKYTFVFANTAMCATVFFLFSCFFILRKMAIQNRSVRQSDTGIRHQDHLKHSRHSRMERRMTKVFSLVLIAYLLCYFPSCVMIYVMNFCGSSCSCITVHWLRDMQLVLVLLNSCLNPILYAWQMKSFRNAFKLIVCNLPNDPRAPSKSDGTETSVHDEFTQENPTPDDNRVIELQEMSPNPE